MSLCIDLCPKVLCELGSPDLLKGSSEPRLRMWKLVPQEVQRAAPCVLRDTVGVCRSAFCLQHSFSGARCRLRNAVSFQVTPLSQTALQGSEGGNAIRDLRGLGVAVGSSSRPSLPLMLAPAQDWSPEQGGPRGSPKPSQPSVPPKHCASCPTTAASAFCSVE